MPISDTAEQSLALAIWQNTTWTAGATLYIGLATAMSDTAYTEVPNLAAYARVSKAASAANFPVTAGLMSLGTAVTWAAATGSWGTPAYVFVSTSGTWGSANSTIIGYQAITSPQPIGSGNTASFAVGDLQFQVD